MAEGTAEKRAPVQGYTPGIPWEMHLRAYDAYRKKYGAQHALIDLEGQNCRGGFGTGELDEFIPGWREELSERKAMQDEIISLRTQLAEAQASERERAAKICDDYARDGRTDKEYACETADELAARIRALSPTPNQRY